MSINMLIEVRPLVQSCCVFLNAPSPEHRARIAIRPNDLTVTWSLHSCEVLCQTVSLPTDVPIKFQPCQVSSLLQEEKHLSFRVQTSPRNHTGSFAVQLVESGKNISQSIDNASSIPTSVPCTIHCTCCGQNILSKRIVSFNRVLPLPSCTFDAGDFFCHNHEESSININPNERDCLYSANGFTIHRCHLEWEARVIRCKSCLAWIGTQSGARASLWHSTVDVRPTLTSVTQVIKLHPAQDFVLIVENTISQCPTVACRLLITVTVSSDVTHYLLVHVIDRQLMLLTANSGQSMELVLHKSIKVSFLLEKHCTEMVSTWLNDQIVSCCEVALPVFVQGIKLLSKTSQYIPSSYRKAPHGFLLAYLCSNFID